MTSIGDLPDANNKGGKPEGGDKGMDIRSFKSPLAKIYLFGKDDVKRPFDSGAGNNPFAKMLKGFQDQQKDEKKKKRYEKIKKKTGAELRKEKRER